MGQKIQREAVEDAVIQVLGGKENITGPVKDILDKDQLKKVHENVVGQFLRGEVRFDGDVTAEKMKKYVPGLVNNWMRKSPLLNGNTKYVPKNPGSRAGSGDTTLKNLKNLREIVPDEEGRKQIDAEIAKRQAEIQAAKAPKVDIDAIPEHLRHLLPQQ